MFIKGKRLMILVVVIFILSSTGIVFAATTPVITSVFAPATGSVYFPSATMTPQAYITNTPSISQYIFPGTGSARVNFTNLGGTLYGGSWTPTTADCYITSSSSGWAYPSGKINASNSAGSASQTVATYITCAAKSIYQSFDNSFSYVSPTVNTFKGTATPASQNYNGQPNTYNCLAYACGNTGSWAQTPNTIADIDDYMMKSGGYSSRPGSIVYSSAYSTIQPWTKAIYYSGYHFAKVIEWDANGNVVRIQSKWGSMELIYSAGLNPFTSATQYGTATRFYK